MLLALSLATGCPARAEDAQALLALNQQYVQLYEAGKYDEALAVAKQAVTLAERLVGPDHQDFGTHLNNLAVAYQHLGRYAEAEPLYKRSLSIREKALGPEHPDVAVSLNNLALLYQSQGRYAEAESLYKRDLAISEKVLGPDHPHVGTTLNNLGLLYENQNRYAEAEPIYKRALAIREKALGPDHPNVAVSLNNLALLYHYQLRFADAEPLYKRSLAIHEKVQGPDHPDIGDLLNNLGGLYKSQRRFAEAEALYTRGLAIREKVLGPNHPVVGESLSNLAAMHLEQRDWARSADHWRRSIGVIARRAQHDASVTGGAPTAARKSEAVRLRHRFTALVKVGHRLEQDGRSSDAGLAGEMFRVAQEAQSSEAAASLAQMAARGAAANPDLSRLVRERQDLVAEWQKRDGARTAAVSQAPDRRDRAAEAVNAAGIAEIDKRLGDIDQRLKLDFADYAALSRPEPLSIEQVQSELRSNEALVLFLDTSDNWAPYFPEETFVWVITKTAMRWTRFDLGDRALAREVAALRCGLDAAEWGGVGAEVCAKLLDLPPDKAHGGDAALPFDTERAHALYKALFGTVEDLIARKHLLVVPSGSLTQLPFQVLVTKPPAGSGFKSVAWLARDHALTVLPAVTSLAALRRVARPSAATLSMIGFGNPLLDGDQSDPRYGDHYKRQAALARSIRSCPETVGRQVTAPFGRGGIVPIAARGGLADLADIKVQAPLPETAKELCDVAANLKADRTELRLGARATEREIKALSASGALAKYRIVHFATHGTLAGQLSPTAEPGLILTPPTIATEEDDGYLSASEIAGLKLDADWVILSACNTAAGASSVEALSGLAQAFFYAQARALLVSHWAVNSDATVTLITSAVREIATDKRVGRAEALRRAMLEMIDNGKPHEAHPSFWAPFVVVGEGAARDEYIRSPVPR